MITIEIFHSDYSLRAHEKIIKNTKEKISNSHNDEEEQKFLNNVLDNLTRNKFWLVVPDGERNKELVMELAEELSIGYHGWAIICVRKNEECWLFSNDFGKIKAKPTVK